jgi:hypothetical protein
MTKFPLITSGVSVIVLGAVLCLAGCKDKLPPAPPKPVAKMTNSAPAVATTNLGLQYVSVFEDLPPAKGRDPFFPDSHRRDPAPPPQAIKARKLQPQGELHLKGIVRSSTHRSAIINSAILTEGEEEAVRVPDGTLRVRCLQIGEDYVVIQVQGESGRKRLALEEKRY